MTLHLHAHPCGWQLRTAYAVSVRLHSCAGETQSEGGFGKDKVSSAALLDVQEATDRSGKTYYKYDILTRTGAGHSQLAASGSCYPSFVWTPECKLLPALGTSTFILSLRLQRYCVCAADGSLGGRHYLITASVGAGNKLYVMKVQAGDKVGTFIPLLVFGPCQTVSAAAIWTAVCPADICGAVMRMATCSAEFTSFALQRWNKGTDKAAMAAWNSFTVA
jgi:PsbP